jgi:hypothetical protein
MYFRAKECFEMSFGNELEISTKNRKINARSIPDGLIDSIVALLGDPTQRDSHDSGALLDSTYRSLSF